MEQNQGFWQKYWYYLLVVAVVVLVIVLIAAQRGPDEEGAQEEQTNTQNSDTDAPENQNQDGAVNGGQTGANGGTVTGNVSARGTLRTSDDAAKGNLVIESDQGRIYIQTARDFSAHLDKDVTLNAEGALQSFVFLGLAETGVTPADSNATGGPAPEEASKPVQITGTLAASDDMSRGNYLILTDTGKVYLQSVRDYTAWYQSEVNLSADGTIESFTNAILTKK